MIHILHGIAPEGREFGGAPVEEKKKEEKNKEVLGWMGRT
jgi:hypothetical protein